MTICKFYATGYCRYGNNCRFQHIQHNDSTESYYSKTYNNRSDGRQPQQPSLNTSNRSSVGFSFNRTLDKITTSNTSPVFPQRLQLSGNPSNYRSNETQNSSFGRNSFQLSNSNNQSVPNQRVATFSFNRTLQQISSGDGVVMDDMDMEATAAQPMRPNTASQPIPFASHSQSNFSFGVNKPLISPKMDPMANRTSVPNTIANGPNDGIYSKASDLTPQDIKQYESKSFTFQSIPICPPTRQLVV